MLDEMSEGQRRVEGILRGVAPAAVGIGRDEMMFAAGRASVRVPRVWPWQVGMAAAVVVCVGALALRLPPQGPVVVERTVVVHEVAPSGAGAVAMSERPERMDLRPVVERATGSRADYLEMRNAVLSRGIDALVSPPTGGGAGITGPAKGWKLEGSESLPAWQQRSL